MTVRVYRWDDAGAPVLNGSASGHTLIGVLNKCLVIGYGTKVAAGWTMEFSGTGKAVFKQGAGSNGMRLRVDSSASGNNVRVRGFETMSDVDSGSGPFPTDAQLSGGGYFHVSTTADTTPRPWLIVSTEKAFYLWVGQGLTTAEGVSGSASYQQTYFFGDIATLKIADGYHTLICCNAASGSTVCPFSSAANMSAAIAGHFMARSHTQIGGAITTGQSHDMSRAINSATFGTNGTSYPDPITGGMLLENIRVFEPGALVTRGVMPGLYAPLHNLPGQPGDTFSGVGRLFGKTFILLDSANTSIRARIAIETSDTW